MAGPLLETKLYIPQRRRGVVPRARLTERLNRGAEAKLTLVSAPAGLREDDAAGRVAGGRCGR
jgi:LuxR family transcriptional regulator, maltose regulon positive regulatory protein